jgi:hypothetical protein
MVLAALVMIVSLIALRRNAFERRNSLLALWGVRETAEKIDAVKEGSVSVFHDLKFQRSQVRAFSVDHILVAPSGVYAVETKTMPRLRRGWPSRDETSPSVRFDGEKLHLGKAAVRGPISKALRNAHDLSSWLWGRIGAQVDVKAVLALPGWRVETAGRGPVEVINADELPGFLSRAGEELSSSRRIPKEVLTRAVEALEGQRPAGR